MSTPAASTRVLARRAPRWHRPLPRRPRPGASRRSRRCSSAASLGGEAEESVLVTGGAGFIGSHLCETLLERGACVIALDDLDDGGPYPRAWKEANLALLRDVAARRASLGARLLVVRADASDPDAIAPFFASSSDDASRPRRACATSPRARASRRRVRTPRAPSARTSNPSRRRSASPSRRLAAFARSSSPLPAPCTATTRGRRRLRTSVNPFRTTRETRTSERTRTRTRTRPRTRANANAPRPTPSREADALVAAANPCAATKLRRGGRRAVFASFPLDPARAAPPPTLTIARVFTVYGPRGRPDMAVFRFARAARTPGATLTMFGDGERTWRDYAHVADVVDGLLAALFREPSEKTTPSNAAIGPAGEADRADHDVLTVNIASGSATRLRELVDVVVGVAAASNEAVGAAPRRRAPSRRDRGTSAAHSPRWTKRRGRSGGDRRSACERGSR